MSLVTKRPFEITGAHVLIALLVFFGVTIGVNILFATLAFRSFPGEDAQSPYQQGLQYNQTLKAREIQNSLGWNVDTQLAPSAKGAMLLLTFRDAAQQPLESLSIEGALRRPTADKYDIPLRFEQFTPGVYQAQLPHLDKGLWDLRAQAEDGRHNYAIDERLIWQPSTQH